MKKKQLQILRLHFAALRFAQDDKFINYKAVFV